MDYNTVHAGNDPRSMFPDDELRHAVSDILGVDLSSHDWREQLVELKDSIVELDLSEYYISDLSGIWTFENLDWLTVKYTKGLSETLIKKVNGVSHLTVCCDEDSPSDLILEGFDENIHQDDTYILTLTVKMYSVPENIRVAYIYWLETMCFEFYGEAGNHDVNMFEIEDCESLQTIESVLHTGFPSPLTLRRADIDNMRNMKSVDLLECFNTVEYASFADMDELEYISVSENVEEYINLSHTGISLETAEAMILDRIENGEGVIFIMPDGSRVQKRTNSSGEAVLISLS